MSAKPNSARLLLLVGLFFLAGFWVFLMGLVTWVLGGSAYAGGAPPDDGSVKAQVTSLSRGKDFEISLALRLTDKAGNILEGLGEQDIDVYEDDTLVASQNFMPAGQGAIRLALVVDYSTSMNGRKIQEARVAARALIRMLRDKQDYIGLYFFNDAHYDRSLSERLPIEPLTLLRREQAWEAIMFTNVGNGSPMLATMDRALPNLAKVSGRKVMVVLTDGMDTEEEEVTKNKALVLGKCQDYRIPLYMVSTASGFDDEKGMRELAERSGGQYIGVPDPTKLKEIFETIGRSLQSEYTMTYTSPNPLEDGQKRHVTVNVRNGRVGTQVTGDYTPPGLLATGATAKKTGSGTAVRGTTLGTTATIFAVLTAVLGTLSFMPVLLRRRPASLEEEAPVATPAPSPAAAPMRSRPTLPGTIKRPPKV